MKELLSLLVITVLSAQCCFANELVISEPLEQKNIAPYVSYYLDQGQQLEIADIQKKSTTLPWAKTNNQQLNFGFSNAAIWLAIDVNNMTPGDKKYLIELPYSLIDNVEFYHINDQGRLLANYIMGSALHFSSRPIAHHNFIIPVSLPARAHSTVFLRITGNHSLTVPMTLWSPEAFWKVSQSENRFNFGYFTLLLALVAYALYRISPQPRIRRYIFPGMIITPLLALLTIEGYGFQYLWPENPEWNQTGLATLIPGSLSFLCLYLHVTFFTVAPESRVLRLLPLLATINILLLIVPIIMDYQYALAMGLASALLYSVSLCHLSIKYWKRISRPKKVTVLGFGWLVVSCIIFSLTITNVLPAFPVVEIPLQIGFFLYAFSLFWAQLSIATRASILSKKKISRTSNHAVSPPCNASTQDSPSIVRT